MPALVFADGVLGRPGAGIVHALLEHGTFDRYLFLTRTPAERARLERRRTTLPRPERISTLDPGDLVDLKDTHDVVLLQTRAARGEVVAWRNAHGSPCWPVHGLVAAPPAFGSLMPFLLEQRTSEDGFICASEVSRAALRKVIEAGSDALARRLQTTVRLQAPVHVLERGVDVERFRPAEPAARAEARTALGLAADARVFLCVVPSLRAASVDLRPLLAAFAAIAQRAERVDLLVAVERSGPERATADLLDLGRSLGCAGHLHVRAGADAVARLPLYAATDIFVVPSDGLVDPVADRMLEAMACGLPVIASDWGGRSSTVIHDATGLLVPARWAAAAEELDFLRVVLGDRMADALVAEMVIVDVDVLAAAMTALLERFESLRDMGANARRHVAQLHAWPVIVARHEELWERCWDHRQCEPATAPYGHSVVDHAALLAGHASAEIQADSVVSATRRGERYAELAPAFWAAGPSLPFDRGLALAVLRACRERPGARVADLAGALDGFSHATGSEVFRHVALLAKWGFVELGGPLEPR